MSRHYKQVRNGNGTILAIKGSKDDVCRDSYISIGKNGEDVILRGNARVIAFDTWEDLVEAIDVSRALYCKPDFIF